MQQQIRLLVELSKLDSEVHEVTSEAERLPAKLAPLLKDIDKLEALLTMQRNQIAENELWVKSQEASIKEEQSSLAGAKTKLQASRNGKDYNAASREIENKRRSVGEREAELLKVFDTLEKRRADLATHDAEIAELKEQAQKDLAEIQVKVEELQKQANEKSAGREELVAKIDKSVLNRYDRVRKKHGNKAVVEALDGACMGCHVALLPQLYNELARAESIECCPRCKRIVFRPEAMALANDE